MHPSDRPDDRAALKTAGSTAGHYLPTLDGWRAVAISMVVASHALTTGDGSGGALSRLTFRLGTFGVMVFFAISGFLICTRLLIEEETRGRISLRSFYLRRIFRILPAAYSYLAVIAVLVLAGVIVANRMDFAAAAFFFSNYVPPGSWYTGHFWSLAIEEHFYLFWPPVLVMFGRKRAALIGAILIVLTVILRLRFAMHAPPGTDLPGYTQLRLDAFMFPCILAIALRRQTFRQRFTELMTLQVWIGLILVLATGIVLAQLMPPGREPQRLIQSALLPIIIAATVMRPDDGPARLLRHPALERLGQISYSVYLWQQLVFGLAPRHWSTRLPALLLLIPAILLIAAASRRWIELPSIAWRRKISSVQT